MLSRDRFLQYLANTFWPLLEKGTRLLLGFFIGTLVVRNLGPETFGKLSYVQGVLAIISVFITFGMDEVISRDLILNKGTPKEKEILGTYSQIRLILTFVITSLIFVITFLMYRFGQLESVSFFLFLILSLQFLFQTSQILVLFYQSQIQNKTIAVDNLTALIICSVLRLILIYIVSTKKAEWFAAVITIEFVINALLLLGHYGVRNIFSWHFNKQYAAQLVRECIPYALSGIFVTLYMRIDQLMIEHFLNNTQLGYYSSAVRLSEVFYFIPAAIAASLFPSIMESINNEEVYLHKFQSLYGLLTFLGLSITLILSLVAPFLIKILYGAQFQPASEVLIIHVWASIFIFFGAAKSKWIVTKKLQKLSFFYIATGAAINFVLNLYFIPIYGVKGAALTTLATQIIITLILPIFFKQDRISVKMFILSFNFINTYKYIRSKI